MNLRPCPHCGGTDLRIGFNAVGERHYVVCSHCLMRGPEKLGDEDRAAKYWNALPRKVESLPDAQLDALEKLAGEATPGPWATYGNSQDVFGRKPYDWFQIYAMIDGEMWVIMCANGNMVELEKCQLPATEKTVRRKQSPGQAGKNARYVAAANPAAVLSLIAEVRAARTAGKD